MAKRVDDDDDDEMDYEAAAQKYVDEHDLRYVRVQDRYVWKSEGGDWKFMAETALSRKVGWNSKFKTQMYAYMEDNGRMYVDVTYSVRPDLPKDMFNLMDMSKWVQAREGDCHPAFPILMHSLGGGKEENINHIEQVIIHKYMDPSNNQLPCIVLHGEGGVGKNLLVDVVLRTMFADATISATPKELIGDFNSLLEGKVVILLNESKADKLDTGKLKTLIGSPRLPINPKNIRQYEVDNMLLLFIGSNDYNGGIWLDRSNADRRFSVIANPRNKTLDTWTQQLMNFSTLAEAVKFRQDAVANVYNNPEEIGKWITYLYLKHCDSPPPTALHGQDYGRLSQIQEPMHERVCRAIFDDPNFIHIRRRTLFDAYQACCKQYNAYPIMFPKFYEGARDYIQSNGLNIIEERIDQPWYFRKLGDTTTNQNDGDYMYRNGLGQPKYVGPDIE
jgi:hypothetical protein